MFQVVLGARYRKLSEPLFGRVVMTRARPVFPITITFHEDSDEWILDNERELAYNLEWFDSQDPEQRASAVDHLNRRVWIKVEKLTLIAFSLEDKYDDF